MDLNRLRTLAGLEPLNEDFGTKDRTFFVYGKCQRKSNKIVAPDMLKAVEQFSQNPVQKTSGDPAVSTQSNPVNFVDENACEYVSYELANESEETSEFEAMLEAEAPKVKNLFGDDEPANTLNMTKVEFSDDTVETNKVKQGVDTEQAEKVKVPTEVFSQIDKRLKELKASIEEYDEKGYNDTGAIYSGVKDVAVDALEKMKDHLSKGDSESYKEAQVYYSTLMSPIQDLLPSFLVRFLHDKTAKVKKKI